MKASSYFCFVTVLLVSLPLSSRAGSVEPELRELWRVTAPKTDERLPIYNPEMVVGIGYDGTAYSADRNGHLIARTSDGLEKWRLKWGSNVAGRATVDERGTVYLYVYNAGLLAIHPSGQIKWRRREMVAHHSTFATSSDGDLYYLVDKDLVALRPDGVERWRARIGRVVQSGPVVATDGTIYTIVLDEPEVMLTSSGALTSVMKPVDYTAGRLCAISLEGRLLWTLDGVLRCSHAALGPDGTVYTVSRGSGIRAVTPEGEVKWDVDTVSRVSSGIVVGPRGTVMCGTEDGYVYAIAADGSVRWTLEMDGPADPVSAVGLEEMTRQMPPRSRHAAICGSPIVLQDGRILIFAGGALHLVEANGASASKLTLDGTVQSMPAVDFQGRLFVTLAERNRRAPRLVVLQGAGKLAAATWPMTGGDPHGSFRVRDQTAESPQQQSGAHAPSLDTLERLADEIAEAADINALQDWAISPELQTSSRRLVSLKTAAAKAGWLPPLGIRLAGSRHPAQQWAAKLPGEESWIPYFWPRREGALGLVRFYKFLTASQYYCLEVGPRDYRVKGTALCVEPRPGVYLMNFP